MNVFPTVSTQKYNFSSLAWLEIVLQTSSYDEDFDNTTSKIKKSTGSFKIMKTCGKISTCGCTGKFKRVESVYLAWISMCVLLVGPVVRYVGPPDVSTLHMPVCYFIFFKVEHGELHSSTQPLGKSGEGYWANKWGSTLIVHLLDESVSDTL